MIIKEKFTLLKDIPNILRLSSAEINKYSVPNGPRKVFVPLVMMKDRIDHYTKDKIFDIISDIEKRKQLVILNYPNYNLHVSYNLPTKQMVININKFGVDDIYPINPDPKNLYACLVYAICFKNLVTKTINIPDSYFSTVVNFILSIFVRLFGKEYGLLGTYSTEITKLKFLISCYVTMSFFGMSREEAYRKSGVVSSFNYREILENLNEFDFRNIEDFIKSLSDLGVMPGITKYSFTARLLRSLSVDFIPAFEDLSRFISIITTSSIKGSSVVPTHVFGFNEDEYRKLLEISKIIFK